MADASSRLVIANPIYDVVFKYLMDDPVVAATFLSTLTGIEIETIEPLPQEMTIGQDPGGPVESSTSKLRISTYRLDYGAWVREKGQGRGRIIIIEVQLSTAFAESLRFRKYLSYQYGDRRLFNEVTGAGGRINKLGVPIFPIYILGAGDRVLGDAPVVAVRTILEDGHKGGLLGASRSDFIDALFHEGMIINIPALKGKRRDEREQLLSIFDQANAQKNKRTMLVQMSDIPEKFHPLIRRLQAALNVEDVGDMILIDDDFFEDMKESDYMDKQAERMTKEAERMVAKAALMIEEAKRIEEEVKRVKDEVRRLKELRKRKEEARMRREEARMRRLERRKYKEATAEGHKPEEGATERGREEVSTHTTDESRRLREKVLLEVEVANKERAKAIKLLLATGTSPQFIAEKLDLSEEEIRRIDAAQL
jgi:hypothetical protein